MLASTLSDTESATLQDTPGTDYDGAMQLIDKHIMNAKRCRVYEEDSDSRDCPMSMLPDRRIDACIMLLPPDCSSHELDQVMERELGPIIPVLAKVCTLLAPCNVPTCSAEHAAHL